MDNHRNVYVRLLNNLEEYIEELKELENVPFGYMVPPNRMCMAIIKCRVFNHDKFLCVSWLGPHNGMMNSDLKKRSQELADLYIKYEISPKSANYYCRQF